MAVLSEEDRKLILGKEWKPLVEEESERRGRSFTVALLAVGVAVVVAYAFITGVSSTGPSGKVAASPAATTAGQANPR